jgi:hypothetical protein
MSIDNSLKNFLGPIIRRVPKSTHKINLGMIF